MNPKLSPPGSNVQQSTQIARRRLRVFWSLAILCVLAYAQGLAGLVFGSWPFADDAPGLFGVWREFSREALHAGTLPLWNPYLFCGLPFMSNGQTSVFYPPNLLYWLLPVRPAMLIDALVHNLWLALGAYALGRSLGLSRTAAWLSAMLLGLGGAVSAHIYAGHLTWHAARSYIPWELTTLLLYLRSGQRRYALGLAVLLSLQMASGYPPFVLLGVGLCCGLLIAWCVTRSRRRWRGEGVAILPAGWVQAVLMAGLLAAALSAVIVLPLREVSGLTEHGAGLPYRAAVTLSGTWRSLVRLILPVFFGGNDAVQWSISYSPHEEVAYVGVLALVLAVGAPLFARKCNGNSKLPPAVLWLWALLPLSAVLALGDNTPAYRWLYDHCVLFRLTRVPVRWLEVWFLAAALLAGFAFDAAIHRRRGESHARHIPGLVPVLWLLAALFLCLALAMVVIAPSAPLWMKTAQWNASKLLDPTKVIQRAGELRQRAIMQSFLAFVLANLAALLVTKWQMADMPRERKKAELLLLLALTLDVTVLFWYSARPVTQQQFSRHLSWPPALARAYRTGERWDTGVSWVAINRGVPLHADLFNGYDALAGRRYFHFASAVEGMNFWIDSYQPWHRSSLLRVAGVTHTISTIQHPNGKETSHDARVQINQVAQLRDWKLWRYRYAVQSGKTRRWESAWPRVYVTRHVVAVAEPQQLKTLQRLSLLPFGNSGRPAVAAPGAFADVAGAAPVTTQDRVLHWQRELNRMRSEVTTTAPAVLVQSESLYPGWRAWVNGQPAPLQAVNYLFRGVQVPAGHSYVQVVYDNQTYRFALFVSLCGLAALAALAIRPVQLSREARA